MLLLQITFDNPQEKQISEMIARINDQNKTINKLEAQQNQNINYIDKIKGIQQNCSTQGKHYLYFFIDTKFYAVLST